MEKKVFVAICLVLCLGLASSVSAGLVGQWGFDEGAGTLAFESGGSANTGTLLGTGTWVAGKVGGAYNFGGVDSALLNLGGAMLNASLTTEEVSLAFWAKGNAGAAAPRDAFYGFGYPSYTYLRVILPNPGVEGEYATFMAGQGFGNQVPALIPADYRADVWHHWAFTKDAIGDMAIYLDGVEVERVTGKTAALNSNDYSDGAGVWIGGGIYGSAKFDGALDDFRIYNHALDLTEVQAIPEPATLALLGIGGVLLRRKRR
jgi:concanavalin A-like lectin/glucanase superfamily protein/PEP-CTERM motif-containing protein